MEEATANQEKLAQQLLKIKTNFKKDTESRKSLQYLEKRRSEAEEVWSQFAESHRSIIDYYGAAEKRHPYFTQNYYSQTEKVYKEVKTLLSRLPSTGPTGAAGPSRNAEDDLSTTHQPVITEKPTTFQSDSFSMDDASPDPIYFVQAEKEQRLRAFLESIRRMLQQPCSKSLLQLKTKTVEGYWSSYVETHYKIMATDSSKDRFHDDYVQQDTFQTMEDATQVVLANLYHQLESTDSEQVQKINLPPLEIPKFYGDYNKWSAFHDLFKKLIHEGRGLNSIQKMNYLKTYICGQAAKLISHLQVCSENYNAAWEILTSRYNNKRLLVSTHVNSLLAQPTMSVESIAGLKNLHDTTSECLHAIQNLGIDTASWGPLLIHILTQKLDKESHRFFELSLKDPREVPTIECLLSFLEARFQSLEAIDNGKTRQNKNYENNTSPRNKNIKTFATTAKATCKLCKNEHSISICPDFKEMSISDRQYHIKKLNICRKCLGSHYTNNCKTNVKCDECEKQHHTLVHNPNGGRPPKITTQQVATNKPADPKPSCSHTNYEIQSNVTEHNQNNQNILLGTAVIKVITTNGKEEEVRLLVDPGSQATFITEHCVKRLQLTKLQTSVRITGVGATDAGTAQGIVHLNIRSRFPSRFKLEIKALVFKTLMKDLPEQSFDASKWKHLDNIVWADPNFSRHGPIDILLGADYYGDIILDGIVKGKKNEPIAQHTELGWVMMGKAGEATHSVCSMITQVDIDKRLKAFWEIEELPEKRKMSKEDLECEEHYKFTHKRDDDGRYTVRIPYKSDVEDKSLGSSKNRALARFLQVERKLAKNPSLRIEYNDFMGGYLNLEHMKLADPVTDNRMTYYMPHHAVFKESSSTTKTRVVFDASAKSNSGFSLNDIMMTGPTLQQDLFSILLRWRKHSFVYTADIEKMFRQIKIDEKDQDVQRILWRNTPSEPINEYKLNTVTYGTASATYLAVKTLRQLAVDDEELYPIASRVALNDFYVDDLMSGSHSLEDAKEAQKQLLKLLQGGGFNLRKWTSNTEELLQHIPLASREFKEVEIKCDDTIKALGILWNPVPDMFHFKVNFEQTQEKQTKRKVLSDASKLFDPLGWLAPTIIIAKMFLQELWLSGLDWDDDLPGNLSERWLKYRNTLKTLEDIKISRWVSYENQDDSVEFHAFCDASESAYGASIYTRITSKADGSVKIVLLTAKAKVAPIKSKLSIPRLELCGAVLASRLIKTTTEAMAITNAKVFAWTDSTIVLAWIRGQPNRWKTFVANRVSEIQETTNPSQWRHVNTEDNPADCASRGIGPEKLKDTVIWWDGPSWLKLSPEHWPDSTFKDTKAEEKTLVSVNTSIIKGSTVLIELFEKFSSLQKIKNILAYCLRFMSNSKTTKSERQYGLLTVQEHQNTFKVIVRLTQLQEFNKEYIQHGENKVFTKGGKLMPLNPFFDNDGIIRLGGRIQEAAVATDSASPMILPSKSILTKLLVQEAHIKTCHGGTQLTLAYLRQNFWILNARNTVRLINNKCTICFRYNAKCREQLMGMLPGPRVKPSQPFTHTGIDYAGPIQVRVSKGRGNKSYKGYICIFICLATKAIHIELVSDLTSAAFLAAFKRFTSRRGLCTNLYSDNGTNFVGANTTLKKELESAVKKTQGEAAEFLKQNGVQWNFIPPSSPHFGGLWEAGVKSIKYHLKRIIGESTLTFEELSTTLSQIEACLNSRPLCPMTSDPTDLAVLTPGHFLIGRQLLAVPEECLLHEKVGRLQRWKLIQQMSQDFWKIWSTEYLARLQQRPKWLSQQPNIQIGDLVLIKDDQNPPARWSLGRVKETHPGKDGLVRVVTLKTKNNDNFKRPVAKVCLLPISDNEQPSISAQHTRTSAPARHLSMLQLICLLLLFVLTVSGQNTEKITQNTLFDPTKMVSSDSVGWKVIVYYNMEAYYQELNSHRERYDELKDSCQQIQGLVRPLCDELVSHFGLSMDKMIRADEVLERTNVGTPTDQSYVSLLENLVESFKANKTNGKNVVISEATHIINENHINDAIYAEETRLKNLFAENSAHLAVDNAKISFIKLAHQYVMSAAKFEGRQQLLIDAVMDVQHGKTQIIPELYKQFDILETLIPSGVTVPRRDAIQRPVTRVTKHNILFWLEVPLIKTGDRMSTHDVHLYIVTYSTTAVVLGLVCYVIWSRRMDTRSPGPGPRPRFILEDAV